MDVAQFRKNLSTLAPRELEVMKQVAMGLSNPQIAEQLGIARRTVENTIVRANKRFTPKLTRSEFVRMWWEAKGDG